MVSQGGDLLDGGSPLHKSNDYGGLQTNWLDLVKDGRKNFGCEELVQEEKWMASHFLFTLYPGTINTHTW